MRCVVTGAAGFIGSHLCETLLNRGHTVIGVDAFIPSYSPIIKANNQSELLAHPFYHFHAIDLRRDNLDETVAEADVIFHFAAMPNLDTNWSEMQEYLSCNVLATHRLLESIRHVACNLKKLIVASSCDVYGEYAVGDESAPTNPLSPYAATKLMSERIIHTYTDLFDMPSVVLRFFSVMGKRQRPDQHIHRFIRKLVRQQPIELENACVASRDWIHVADCVEAAIASIGAPAGEIYNVGSGIAYSDSEMIQQLEELTGLKARIIFRSKGIRETRQAIANTTKIRNHLGWRALSSLSDALLHQWNWQSETYLQHSSTDLCEEPAVALS